MQNRRPLRTLSRSYFRDMLPGGSLRVLCSHHMFSSVDRRTSSEEPDGFVAGRAICVFDPEAISFAISPTGIPPLP